VTDHSTTVSTTGDATTNDGAAGVIVRPAREDDVPLIGALIRELADYERAPERAVATDDDLRAALFGERPAAEVLIVSVDSEPVGFALFFHNFSTWTGRRGLYLEDLFVRPTARRRGAGRILLGALGRIAVERGCARMDWAVLDWNDPAIAFYRTLGAEPLDEWTIFRLSGASLAALGAGPPA